MPIFLGAWVVTVIGCGEPDPFCGDGEPNPGEECDDGNDDDSDYCLNTCKVRAIPTLTLRWEFNHEESLGFSGDSCLDVGVSKVKVELAGGADPILMEDRCSLKQVVFVDIAPGTYTAKLQFMSADDVSMTNNLMEQTIEYLGGNAEARVNVPPAAWSQDYLGDFYFRVTWAGRDRCSAEGAPERQRLTLVTKSGVFQGKTTFGAKVDGSDASPCTSGPEREFLQTVLNVPYGPANLRIEGLDSVNNVLFDEEFATFVGAGPNNPELTFDVDEVDK